MIGNGTKDSYADDLSVQLRTDQQNLNSYPPLAVQRDQAEKNFMEMEGRGYSDIFRNSSEELFMKSLMESSIGMPLPNMEMLGLKNLSQNFRTDSAELFQSWLTTGENHGHNSTGMPHRTRQASRRMSTELASLYCQQHEGMPQRKRCNNDYIPENASVAEDLSSDLNQHSMRNAAERGLQASNLYLAKAWFHSSQPMTRSRSSELRRKYVAMQNAQTAIGIEAMHNASGQGVEKLEQEFVNPNGFSEAPMCQNPNQLGTFMSPSNSSSSTFNTPQLGNVDKVSSVVSMLKGTLERKKLNNHIEREAVEDSSNGLYCDQEVMIEASLNQGQGNHFHEMSAFFREVSPVQLKDSAALRAIDGPIDLELEGILTHTNPNQLRTISHEPSQSESSAAAPVVSSGLDAGDGPSNSGQTLSFSECSRKQDGNSRRSDSGAKSKDFRERIFDNLKDDRKRGSLVRYGSVTSAGSVDKGDPTKKRRVERSRKMAEAKERSTIPAIPSDMQSVLKRCENLEKEVRSLKLNLSFMNRKDSEQTKQIEELQKQNEELAEEKERLLEEIERILSRMGNM